MIVFWLSIIIILAFVCVIFYQTLKKNVVNKEENADLNFYKSQLSEIEKDIAKGTIAPEEAEQLKVEISRRILKNKNQPLFKFSSQSTNSQIKIHFYFRSFYNFSFVGPLFIARKLRIFRFPPKK